MNTFLIIMGVALWVGFSALQKKKQLGADSEDTSVPFPDDAKSVFETLFQQHIVVSPEMESFEEDFGDVVDEEPGGQPYQTKQPEVVEPAPVATPVAFSTQPSSQPVVSGVDFDLRQAVIYQTILSNKYIDEFHSSEVN